MAVGRPSDIYGNFRYICSNVTGGLGISQEIFKGLAGNEQESVRLGIPWDIVAKLLGS